MLAPNLARQVLITESVVGVADTPQGVVAVGAEGGLFRARPGGPPQALLTPLPVHLARLESAGAELLACHPERAWRSTDAGQRWFEADFGCGADGRRTAVFLPPTMVRLDGDAVVIRALPEGADVARVAPPLGEPPVAIGGAGQHVVVFGRTQTAWSADGGRSFTLGERDDGGLLHVRDVAFLGKGLAVAVGAAGDGGSILRSVDGGRRWHRVGAVPRRAEALHAVAVGADGELMAVTGADRALGVFSGSDALRWWLDPHPRLAAEAVAPLEGGGFVAGSPRGVVTRVGPADVPARLDRPLRAIASPHPRVWIGVGEGGGLFRTEDAGARWAQLAGSSGFDLADVCRVAGHQLVLVGGGVLWTSEDAGRTWSPRTPPQSCAPRWVRFAETGAGVVACDDGTTLRSGDAGWTWREGGALPPDVGPPIWVSPSLAVASAADGRALWLTEDAGRRWSTLAPPVPVVASVAAWGEGLSVATADGRVFTAASPSGPWRSLPTGRMALDVLDHVVLGSARVMFLTADALFVTTDGAAPRRLAETPGALGVQLLGDGGALVRQHGATTRLRPR